MKKGKQMKIDKNTTVHDALKLSKNINTILRKKYNIDCARCKGSVECTIDKIAFNKGLDLKQLLIELNEEFKK
jgi:hypothetical protein